MLRILLDIGGLIIGIIVAWVFYHLHQKEIIAARKEIKSHQQKIADLKGTVEKLQTRTQAAWVDIEYGVMDIRAKLIDDNFIPDVLVCPNGTSLIVNELLALSLESKNPEIPIFALEAIPIRQQEDNPINFIGDGEPFDVDSARYRYLIPSFFTKLRGLKALVFDDGSVTGGTLLQFQKELSGRFQMNVKRAALFASKGIETMDDRVPEFVHRWVFINDFYMPWGHILQDTRCRERP